MNHILLARMKRSEIRELRTPFPDSAEGFIRATSYLHSSWFVRSFGRNRRLPHNFPIKLVIRYCVIFVVMLLGIGCSPKTRPAKFYLLQPISQPQAITGTEKSANSTIIGVGPIDIPAYLDRPQIVSGGPDAQLQLDEFHRWAEPLRDNFTRVLAENLSTLLPSSHVLAFPWNRAVTPNYQVEVQIIRFQVNLDGGSELKANWSVLQGNKPILMKEFDAQKRAPGEDFASKVAAQSGALADFSREIAMGLQLLSSEKGDNP